MYDTFDDNFGIGNDFRKILEGEFSIMFLHYYVRIKLAITSIRVKWGIFQPCGLLVRISEDWGEGNEVLLKESRMSNVISMNYGHQPESTTAAV